MTMAGDVLVVDDDEAESRLLRTALSTHGMSADVATSAGEAQRLLAAQHYKVVVAAWNVSGPEVMEALRTASVRPIVILIAPPHSAIPPDPTDMVCLVLRRPLDGSMVGQMVARCVPPPILPAGPGSSAQSP